jgi:hypothetical protein
MIQMLIVQRVPEAEVKWWEEHEPTDSRENRQRKTGEETYAHMFIVHGAFQTQPRPLFY